MDVASLIGIGSGIVLMGLAIWLGGSASAFWDLPSVMITFGGTVAGTLIAHPLPQLFEVARVVKHAFISREPNYAELIDDMVSMAQKARREGLLALEEQVQESQDGFLKKAVELVVDGTDPELTRDILEKELSCIEERHKSGQRIFETMGALAPAFGMIGTLIGLIQMLRTLDDPSKIGPGMATALVTTFYGAIAANLVFIPIAKKLRSRSADEVFLKHLMIEGILAIQAGQNPRLIEDRLKGFIPPKYRSRVGKKAAAVKAEAVASSTQHTRTDTGSTDKTGELPGGVLGNADPRSTVSEVDRRGIGSSQNR
ncbi:MAG TPA: motility protein A [Clostridia bacterium]|nr:motility protein A [Clostridia bacterium]